MKAFVKQSGIAPLLPILIIGVVLVLIGGGYVVSQKQFSQPQPKLVTPMPSSSAAAPTPIASGSAKACVRGGCSGQLCIEEGSGGGITTCEFKPEYGCYQAATCERQPTGECGFTQTPQLKACLLKAKSQ